MTLSHTILEEHAMDIGNDDDSGQESDVASNGNVPAGAGVNGPSDDVGTVSAGAGAGTSEDRVRYVRSRDMPCSTLAFHITNDSVK
jgi:hypothetical protein